MWELDKKYTYNPEDKREVARCKVESPHGGHYYLCHVYFTYGEWKQGDGTYNVWCKSHSPGWQGGGNDYEILFVPEKHLELASKFISEIFRDSDYNSTIYGHDVYAFRWGQSYREWRDKRFEKLLKSKKYSVLKQYIDRTVYYNRVCDEHQGWRMMDEHWMCSRPIMFYPKSKKNELITYDDSKLKKLGFEISTCNNNNVHQLGRGDYRFHLNAYDFDKKELYDATKKSIKSGMKLIEKWKKNLFYVRGVSIDDYMDIIVDLLKPYKDKLKTIGPIKVQVLGGGKLMTIHV